MGRLLPLPLKESEVKWIREQKIMFVASAPSGDAGRVNVSPKSARELRVLDGGKAVAYLDYTGSGAETAAHLAQNGRLTFMFVALHGAPKIVRFYGCGEVVMPQNLFAEDAMQDPVRKEIREAFGLESAQAWPAADGARCIVRMKIDRASQSCGYSIPIYNFEKERDTLQAKLRVRGVDGCLAYRDLTNAVSIDGLPSLCGLEHAGQLPIKLWNEEGYIRADYSDGQSLKDSLARIYVWLRIRWAAGGLHGRRRDVAFFFAGLVAALALTSLQRRRQRLI